MQWSVIQQWRDGKKMDSRTAGLTREHLGSGWLRVLPDKSGRLVATFRVNGEQELLPPLIKAEILELTDKTMTLAGLQQATARGPWHYQVWSCVMTHGDRTA